MKIIIGLGNPGPRYETTRHNAGFLVLDRLVERWRADGPASRYFGELYSADRDGEKLLLVKPQTFMNASGKCVGPLFQFYKCAPEDLIVIHDDIDLKPLTLRIKTGGGNGGHNGLRSIDASIGGANTGYHRIRIGVGRPERGTDPRDPADYVLEPFTDEELAGLDPLLDRACEAIEMVVKGDVQRAMTDYNR